MTWKDIVILCIIIIGIVLFLYGSNYYDVLTGWSGIALVFAGIVAEIALEVYSYLKKRGN